MPQRVQTLRTSTKNQRPTAGTREPGELYVSFPDLQLGVIDAAKTPKDLIAVRFFSALTNYAVGDFVIQAGRGYRANTAIVSGAFNASQWDMIPSVGESEPPIPLGTTAQYWRGDKSWQTLNKSAVGLGAVDNTSDANKPVSDATQTALNLKANLASPTFTGDPKAPTPTAGDNDTSIATTAFVVASFAPIMSPTFGGDPKAPTPATSDNDTSIATTAYVKANLASYAPLVSPAFTGNPTAPTPGPGDNDTSIATTQFVTSALTAASGAFLTEAPVDGLTYGRKNAAWSTIVGGAVVSDTPPGGPLIAGQLWYESDSGNTYIWYSDGDSSQWIQQNIQPATPPMPSGQTALSRNRIVNGAMQVSQEQGNTNSGDGPASQYFTADQWNSMWGVSPGTLNTQRVQVVTPNGSLNRSRMAVVATKASLTGDDNALWMHPIEGLRVADFRYGTASARQSVLRFGWKSPAGTYSIAVGNYAGDRSYVATFTIAAGQANTDTTQTIVIPGDTTGIWAADTSGCLWLYFAWAVGPTNQGVAGWQAGYKVGTSANTNGMATAGNAFELFDVGLYLDPASTGVAPPWQMPDEAEELIACQRYWQQTMPGFWGQVTTGFGYNAVSFPSVRMRLSVPAVTAVDNFASAFPATSGVIGFLPPDHAYESRFANATYAAGGFRSLMTLNARM